MQDRSGCLIFIMLLVLLVSGLGLFFVINSNSRIGQEVARTSGALSKFASKIEFLEAEIVALKEQQSTPVVVTVNNDGGTKRVDTGISTPSTKEPTDTLNFANAEFRQPEAEEGGRRVSSVGGFSGSMNSLLTNESTTSQIYSLTNDTLGARNNMDVMKFEPVLAESWTKSDDGLVYIIKIRENATWQAYTDPVTEEEVPAKPVTSDDFLFFWEILQNKDVPVDPQRSYFEKVESIEVVDRYTLKVTWREPYFLAEQITLGMSPIPRHYYRPDPATTDEEFSEEYQQSERNQFMIGFGKYLLDSYEPGSQVVLKRNENYYGPKPPLKKIVMRVIKEPGVRLVEFDKGGLDVLGLLPEQWLKETVDRKFYVVTPDAETAIVDSWAYDELKRKGEAPIDHQFEKFQYPARSWYYIGYNTRRPLFKDKRVRRALTHLTNRKRILRDVFYNFGTIMAGPFIPASPYCDKSIKPLAFDPDKAAALLKEAGWEDTDGDGWLDKDYDGTGIRKPFSYTFIIVSSSTNARKYATIMQQDMRAAGIDLQISPLEWSVYVQKLDERDYEVCTLGWTGSVESDPNQIWHGDQADKPKSSNHVGYKNPEADKLIEQGRKTLDTKKREEIFQKFYRIVHEDQPYTFLFNLTSLVTYDKRYRNARVYELGMDSDPMWTPDSMQKVAP